MINQHKGAFEIICDGCESESQTFELEWSDFIEEAKRYGWQFRKEKDGWSHYCNACSKFKAKR